MIRMKPYVDVVAMLKDSGYSTYRIAQDRILGQSTLTKLRRHGKPSWNELDMICNLCGCSPWDIMEYIPEPYTEPARDTTQPQTDTD